MINVQLTSTNVVYDSFNVFLKTINIYIIIKEFVFVIKYSKKLKKEILHKIWLKYDINRSYKVKKHKV